MRITDSRPHRNQWLPITVICLAASALSFWSEAVADVVRILIGFVLVMRARPDGLIGLFILYFSGPDFYSLGDFKTMSAVEERVRLPGSPTVFGFPVNLPTLNCAFVSIRVFWELLASQKTFVKRHDRILLALWLLALIPATIAFLISYHLRQDNWTRGMRFLLTASSYFYGLILARRWNGNWLSEPHPRLVGFVFVMLTLMNAAIYWSHHGFLFVALGSAFSIYYIKAKLLLYKIIGLLLLALSARYYLNSTTTMLGVGVIALVLSIAVNTRVHRLLIPGMFMGFGYLAIAFSLSYSVVVVTLSSMYDVTPGMYSNVDVDASVSERILSKTFSDRLPLWLSAYEQIKSGPYFLVPSGRPLLVKDTGGEFEWSVGCHNVPLETFRNCGFLIAPIIMGLFVFALRGNLIVMAESSNRLLATFSAGIWGVALAGLATGDFPADMTVGFFIWSLSGAVTGLHIQAKLGALQPAMKSSLTAPAAEPASAHPLRTASMPTNM
jgi:hypothetical protein